MNRFVCSGFARGWFLAVAMFVCVSCTKTELDQTSASPTDSSDHSSDRIDSGHSQAAHAGDSGNVHAAHDGDSPHGEHLKTHDAHSRNATQPHQADSRHQNHPPGADRSHAQHGHQAHAKDKHQTHSQHGHQAHAKDTRHVENGHGVANSDSHGKHQASTKNQPHHGKTNNHGHSPADQALVSDNELDRIIATAKDGSAGEANDPLSLFTERILPIMKSKNASSCTQCHFSGVELRDFIDSDQAKTFAALKEGGLIDVDKPDQSKLLRFIARQPTKSDALMNKVRMNELVAFRTWIRAAVKDPALLKATSDIKLGTTLPDEVIRHARKDRVLNSFIENIWNEMGRCINCHNPERNRQKIGRNGLTKEDVDLISWIVPRDPGATLQKLVDGGNIDFEEPSKSYVLTKPAGIDDHGGGPKFFPGGETYRKFDRFLSDYAAIVNDKYKKASDLPKPAAEINIPTEQQLRVTNLPRSFADRSMQVDIFRWNPRTRAWSKDRWATGFSRVNKQKLIWQNPIALTAPRGSAVGNEFIKMPRKLLPNGRYLVKIYVDRQNKTKTDPNYQLGKAELVKEIEFTGPWKPGYQPPKIISFGNR